VDDREVKREGEEGKGKEALEEEEGDSMARARIAMNVDPKFYNLIKEKRSARSVWVALMNYFTETKMSTKIQLKAKFYTMVMSDKETLVDYVDRVKEVWEKMLALGDEIKEVEVVYKVICTVTKRYDGVMMAAMQMEEGKLTLNFVKGQFRLEDTRVMVRHTITERSSGDGSTSLMSTTRSVICFRCGKPGHIARNCDEREKRESDDEEKKKKKKGSAANMTGKAISF